MKGHPQRRYFKFSNESAENLLVPLREDYDVQERLDVLAYCAIKKKIRAPHSESAPTDGTSPVNSAQAPLRHTRGPA